MRLSILLALKWLVSVENVKAEYPRLLTLLYFSYYSADALADAVDAGLVKTVGVSNYSLDEIKTMHAALKKRGIQLASNQVSFSLIRTIPEKSGLIKLCHDLGVAVLAYSRKSVHRSLLASTQCTFFFF